MSGTRLTRQTLAEHFLIESRISQLQSTSLALNKAIAIREEMFLGIEDMSVEELISRSGSPEFSIIQSMFNSLVEHVGVNFIHGLGVEIGAGLGLLSCAILESDNSSAIDGIVALEACRPYVNYGIRRVAGEFIPSRINRLLPLFDTFEDMNFMESVFDFAVQIESLHHAEDLRLAIREIARVLRPGGYFLSIDRSWPDSVRTSVLEELLDHEYSLEWKLAKGFSPDLKLSRRDNGEHEYRDEEWQSYFLEEGFDLVTKIHLQPPLQTWEVAKALISRFGLANLAGIKVKSRKGILSQSLLHSFGVDRVNKCGVIISPHPRPLVTFLLQKRF